METCRSLRFAIAETSQAMQSVGGGRWCEAPVSEPHAESQRSVLGSRFPALVVVGARLKAMDPGAAAVLGAIIAGVVAVVTAALGFRTQREVAATQGLQTLIQGLQADRAEDRARIAGSESRIDRLELALEERDSEIKVLEDTIKERDATILTQGTEITRLTLLSNTQANQLVELQVSRATAKSAEALEALAWDPERTGELL